MASHLPHKHSSLGDYFAWTQGDPGRVWPGGLEGLPALPGQAAGPVSPGEASGGHGPPSLSVAGSR